MVYVAVPHIELHHPVILSHLVIELLQGSGVPAVVLLVQHPPAPLANGHDTAFPHEIETKFKV